MVIERTGVDEQLTPDEQQVVGTEVQQDPVPGGLPQIEQDPKRIAPLPAIPRAPLPEIAAVAEVEARQLLFGQPVLRVNKYSGDSKDWQMLVRWDVPAESTGDLEEIALLSDNDSRTRYRVLIANVDQALPTDRDFTTPMNFKWAKNTVIPGGTSVTVEVQSPGELTINVDGTIVGTER
ncbi:hypothetical protein LCGC14_3032350 [marine sediment metagenome]|uniref:Uncharacterized protein n=1 Tax=marine sediment metagenome TaxID=412755 RepID=A0A0F8ZI46_9ZZZZ